MINDGSFSNLGEANGFRPDEKEVVIPVIEEFASVGKKRVETANITVTKKVLETTEAVDVALQSEVYHIEHVTINKYVNDDAVPTARQEGDTFILPVLKEVLVKRMLLVEEVRITKRVTQTTEPQHITLRTETVDVKRVSVMEK